MLGSNFIIVERLEESVFLKFAQVFLQENGYKDVFQIIRKTTFGANFSAVKDGKKCIIRVQFSTSLKHISDIEMLIEFRKQYQADYSLIFAKQEFTTDVIDYLKTKNCEVISKIEIENWLNSKFTTCIEFIEYLENKEIRRRSRYSPQELTKMYYDLKAILGRQPSINDISKNMEISYGTYSHRWGTYRNFIASINDTPAIRFSRPNKSMRASVSELLETYLQLRKKLERPPTATEIETLSKYTTDYYSHFFGSWSNFVMLVEKEIIGALKLKKKDLIKEYRVVQEIVNRPPTFDDINKKSKISPIVYLYHWDTWNNFLKSVGEKKQYRNITDKELVLAYFDLKVKLNKTPSQTEFRQLLSLSHDVFDYRFGSWNNFVELMQNKDFINPKPNDIDLLSDYYRIKKILGDDNISIEDIRKHSNFKISDYEEYYLSMDHFKQVINNIEEISEIVSEDELISEYLRLLQKLKKEWLTIYDFKYHSDYYYPIYLVKFKIWANVLVMMRDYVGKIKYPKQISNQELYDDYFRVEKLLNKSPLYVTDIEKHGKYCMTTYEHRFGSWKKFLEPIGQRSVLDISNEDIIQDYYRVKKQLNKKVVLRRDYNKHGKYSDTSIRRRFGKWSLFLESMGEDTSHIKKITKELLIEDYQRVKKLLDKYKVNQTEMDIHGKFAKKTYGTYFGSWDNFLIFMGEDTSRKIYNEQAMIDEYFRVKDLLNKEFITQLDMNQHANICATLYVQRFGSWKKFLDKVGEDTERMRPITDDELIAEYLRIKKELNKSKLILQDIQKLGKYKFKAYRNHFGSWDNFIRMMGDGNSRNINTDQEVIDEYWRVKDLLCKNYINHFDMDKYGKFSSSLYGWRFGSWKKFLEKIGEEPDFRKAKKKDKIDK